jgi:hypothetical protein
MKWFIATAAFAILAFAAYLFYISYRPASASSQFAQEEIQRAKKYHELTFVIKSDQAVMSEFVAGWTKICKVKGQTLTMDQSGDPACTDPQPPKTEAKP